MRVPLLKKNKRIVEQGWRVANPLEKSIIIFGLLVWILGVLTLIIKG